MIRLPNHKNAKFSEYQEDGHLWITLSTGEYYPDVLPSACELYKPVLVTFGQLLKSAHSSTDFFLSVSETKPRWMRIQLCRVFRKYVSPETSVEMLKRKSDAQTICDRFGKKFRPITEVQSKFQSRPMPDEALCAVLWEYKERGKKGYDLTERLFMIVRKQYPRLDIIGPERAGKDVMLGELFGDYPKPDRPVDFVLLKGKKPVAVGLARYDSDRGGAQEDDRTGQYRDCAAEILDYSQRKELNLKVIFLNDGPGLLLGSMWRDYSDIEDGRDGKVKVVTLRMFPKRITMKWLLS